MRARQEGFIAEATRLVDFFRWYYVFIPRRYDAMNSLFARSGARLGDQAGWIGIRLFISAGKMFAAMFSLQGFGILGSILWLFLV